MPTQAELIELLEIARECKRGQRVRLLRGTDAYFAGLEVTHTGLRAARELEDLAVQAGVQPYVLVARLIRKGRDTHRSLLRGGAIESDRRKH